MSMTFLRALPAQLTELLSRLTAQRAARLDANISSRQPDIGLTTTHRDRINTTLSSRADQASVNDLLAAVGDLENGATLRSEEFLSSGTFTAPKAGTYWVTMCGGGGGGAAHNSYESAAYGGFGALCIDRHPVELSAGEGVTVTVGAGGSGGHAHNTNGHTHPTSGGSSWFGNLEAVGGTRGFRSVLTSSSNAEGANGTHPGVNDSTVDSHKRRPASQRGYPGGSWYGSLSGGGAGAFGPGGNAARPSGGHAPSGSGGGGGASTTNSGASNAESWGGNGGSGRVIVEWVE